MVRSINWRWAQNEKSPAVEQVTFLSSSPRESCAEMVCEEFSTEAAPLLSLLLSAGAWSSLAGVQPQSGCCCVPVRRVGFSRYWCLKYCSNSPVKEITELRSSNLLTLFSASFIMKCYMAQDVSGRLFFCTERNLQKIFQRISPFDSKLDVQHLWLLFLS